MSEYPSDEAYEKGAEFNLRQVIRILSRSLMSASPVEQQRHAERQVREVIPPLKAGTYQAVGLFGRRTEENGRRIMTCSTSLLIGFGCLGCSMIALAAYLLR